MAPPKKLSRRVASDVEVEERGDDYVEEDVEEEDEDEEDEAPKPSKPKTKPKPKPKTRKPVEEDAQEEEAAPKTSKHKGKPVPKPRTRDNDTTAPVDEPPPSTFNSYFAGQAA